MDRGTSENVHTLTRMTLTPAVDIYRGKCIRPRSFPEFFRRTVGGARRTFVLNVSASLLQKRIQVDRKPFLFLHTTTLVETFHLADLTRRIPQLFQQPLNLLSRSPIVRTPVIIGLRNPESNHLGTFKPCSAFDTSFRCKVQHRSSESSLASAIEYGFVSASPSLPRDISPCMISLINRLDRT